MGCSAASRLTKEIKLTNDEIEQLKKVLANSTQLGKAIEVELNKISKTAEILTANNDRIQQEIIISKAETGAPVNLSEFESDRDEQVQFREWIESEMKEGSMAISSLAKLHGLEQDGAFSREQQKQMQSLADSDYAIEKLKDFTIWKRDKAHSVLDGLMDDRVGWIEFIEEVESEVRSMMDSTDKDSGGRARPQLLEPRAKLAKLPGITQLLPRFQALMDIEHELNNIRFSTLGDSDGDSKAMIARQAEEIKGMTQRLATQRKLEDERKDGLEKELSLKEVQIKHLENKVKDLSRPSQADNEAKAKDREMERVKTELAREAAELKEAEEEVAGARKANEERKEIIKKAEEELVKLRG